MSQPSFQDAVLDQKKFIKIVFEKFVGYDKKGETNLTKEKYYGL
jgi:hypothetical protein